MSLISLDHVSKIYPRGTRPALDDVSLHVDRGDFVFLVGASGSGKTTLLSLLLREEEANGGEIHVAGNDLRRLSNRQVPQYRRSLGFIFQDYKLLNNKTVYQNVAFALEVIGTSRSTIRSLVPRVLETVGLTGKENNYPHELSGGEAQRVAIARAYVNHPQIILADEPTGNLDPTTSLGIMEVLDAINRTGTTIVMATHNEEIVNSMRKRVVELHAGKIVRDEREGSYDSALYFPDSEVEHNSKAQQTVENSQDQSDRDAQKSIAQSEHTERHKRLSKKAQRAAQAREVVDMVTQSLKSDTSENEGIARLAQSVHSGRTGRYGEVFQSLETTMTWGRGLISSNDNEDVEENDSEVEISEDNKESSEVAGNSETAETANTTETTETTDNHETAETNESHESHETAETNESTESTENSEVSEESQSETGDELQSEAESKLQSDVESERKSQLPPMPPAPPKPPVAAENTNNENISVDDSNNDINKTEGAE
ncbi:MULTISPECIES: cell division ATP-binding protein FtsE [Gardnerella]|uniref:cell division ATP-binding protein FtsE n=1 Tax=Gardnerella TaxID=2701 RepID=UPI0001C218C7|nr:cell division ATP-binding protein FtsE [Gardnerella sp. 26-12]ADB14178.1 cell division ATP-binding protein FtsE [Gardnerella vaginalis 409-05]PMC44145.1 cell division ATP-binding protein FtsE [Gardnerella vaginalis]PMC51377.1 cell division ATP-binding protein FtsE [Gardnerella vaginalis]PMC53564.1 cell division ATP-binding protein FtsE [Gardnerella vaginalis]RFD72844.1 cell division ATP-binding protein FtsE [Gardnerella vaginalis]